MDSLSTHSDQNHQVTPTIRPLIATLIPHREVDHIRSNVFEVEICSIALRSTPSVSRTSVKLGPNACSDEATRSSWLCVFEQLSDTASAKSRRR